MFLSRFLYLMSRLQCIYVFLFNILMLSIVISFVYIPLFLYEENIYINVLTLLIMIHVFLVGD